MKDKVFKHNIKYLITILIIIITGYLLQNMESAAAMNKEVRTIKVGYCKDYGIVNDEESEIKTGYLYDYLNEISKYTDWNYEFVQYKWEDALKEIKNGNIDLLGPIQYSEERAEFYDFTAMPIGKEYASLYANKNNKELGFDDFEAFNGITVATTYNNYHNIAFENYCIKNEFDVKYVYYNDAVDIMRAVNNGVADAYIAGSIITAKDSKVIGRFAIEPIYLAVKKGDSQILDELNSAISKIQTHDMYFEADLYKKYFNADRSKSAVFTNEEERYIKSTNNINVVYNSNKYPVEYYDEETASFKGSNADVLKYIAEYSGLDFKYIDAGSDANGIKMVQNGSADVLCGYVGIQNKEDKLQLSYAYCKSPIVFVGLNNSIINDNTVVALPEEYISVEKSLKKSYPFLEVKVYETKSQCMKEVYKGKGNVVTAENFHILDQLLMTPEYDKLRIAAVTDINFEMCSAISEKANPLLLSIINKSIEQMPAGKMEEIRQNNSISKHYSVSIKAFLVQYSLWILLIVIVSFCIGILLITRFSRRNKEKLEKMAFEDKVTGRENITKFKVEVNEFFTNNNQTEYEIILFDVDKFKYINDIFGFKAGDFTLKTISDTISEWVLEGELFARENADNFVVLCKSDTDNVIGERIENLFDNIRKRSITFATDYELILNAGVYQITEEDNDINTMIDRADIAQRTIKGKRNRLVAFYTQDLRDKLLEEKEIENNMVNALLNNEFIVYLQPKYNINTGNVAGAEALVRWISKEKGMIMPMSFIPVFEKNGFVVNIDLFVFEETCKKLKQWIDNGIKPIPISVNLSRVHLQNDKFIEKYKSIINKYDIPASLVEIELTESAVFDNIDVLMDMMDRLKKIGFSISMDDFGTGYSSLGLLKNVPVDILKLDREFLNETSATIRGEIVIRKIVEMAKELGIKIVAEGVETEDQVDYLRLVGCDIVQGFYYAKPMEISSYEMLLYGRTYSQ